ncbi:sensor domain-containing protein [Actinophytocola sp.]|uniref:sensor domain-containing protein n=1 Tax=Actinophytocola sp. TaxID=1872138 RepID=UPI002ED0F1BF
MNAVVRRIDESDTAAKPDYELVVDLALSVGSAAMWSFDVVADRLISHSGLDNLLELTGESEVHTVMAELVRPLLVAAHTGAGWQDFELEQNYETPGGGQKWLQLRARLSADTVLTGVAMDVTARQEDRQALADLADRYRLLVELSPDAICVHEAGMVKYTNAAGVRFVGAHGPDEIVGRPITSLVHPESIPEMMRRIKELSDHGAASEPAEAKILRFDGTTVDVEAVSVRTTWEGRPAFQVIMRDVTAQKAAEAALHYQAALVSHVSDAIIGTTEDGLVTSWNPAAQTVYGHAAADAEGQPVQDLVGAPLDPRAIIRSGGVAQAVHRKADGSPLTIRVSAAEMDSGYVLVCADETARRRAEQYFSTVVASLEEGVVVVGRDGLVESANPAAQRILGVREEDMIGSLSTAGQLYDENNARIPEEHYAFVKTSRTGVPRNGWVVRLRRSDGRSVWLSISCRPLTVESSLPAAVVISFTDITESRAIAARLEHQATHDGLTGLVNRTLVVQRLNAPVRRRGTRCVLFLDLDKFKLINDSLGHAVGDQVLVVIGERLRRCVRAEDLVGRLGGDEFVVIAEDMDQPRKAAALAEKIRDVVAQPVVLNGRHLHVDVSIGIVLAGPEDTRSGEDALRDADVAMYEAKTRGPGRFAFFDVDLRERMQRHHQLGEDLRDAVRDDLLSVVYQPIIDLKTGAVASAEALSRWTHPVHGPVSPVEFIQLAEESALINALGAQVLSVAALAIAGLHADGMPIELAVNLSPRQLDDPELVPAVRQVLMRTGLPSDALCLEITENALMHDPTLAAQTLSRLRDLGVRLAIDDFGTGYSSLAQLRKLPLDQLKIDRSFVTALGESRDAETIVTSIIAMAHAVDLTVVAEGVETEGQLSVLRRLGCDHVQGYLLGRPGPLEALIEVNAQFRQEVS